MAINLTARAQQEPLFSQNMNNKMTVNPGFAGMRGNWTFSGVYRNQWSRMDGSPQTIAVNLDMPLKIMGVENGLALNMVSDKFGLQKNTQAMFNYAYKAKLEWGVLGVGAKIGFVNAGIEGEYITPDGGATDPALSAKVSDIVFDAGMGAFLAAENFYAGISLAHLNNPRMDVGQLGEYSLNRHTYLTGGYTFIVSPSLNIQPSAFFGTDFVSIQYSVNANAVIKDLFWAGLSFRGGRALSFMGGIEWKEGLTLGYSYDWNVSSVGQYVGGTHEVTFSYTFNMNLSKSEKTYKSIRFL
ncbi:membrane protein [Bacteroidia bacterium]|nr:membrane protein [Bacteroidia bacterium]